MTDNKLPETLTIHIGPKKTGIVQEQRVLKLVSEHDPALRTECTPADLSSAAYLDNSSLAECMWQTCKKFGGYGLSANQLGVTRRLFVMDIFGQAQADFAAFFNPVILAQSEQTDVLDEGCLSFPYVEVPVKRPLWVILQWNTIYGEVRQRTFHGLTARVICHEMDHLNGKTIFDHVTPFEGRRAREKAAKILKKVSRQYKK